MLYMWCVVYIPGVYDDICKCDVYACELLCLWCDLCMLYVWDMFGGMV